MRSPEELDSVEWTELGHAYGDGGDVPDWIRALYSGDPDRAKAAVRELFGRVLHQGSVYSASVAAVPFLAHAAVHAAHERASALAFLSGVAGRADEPDTETHEEGGERVAAEVRGLLHLTTDDDPEVRREAVRLALRASGADIPAAVRALTAAHETDTVTVVRADALTVRTRLDPDGEAVERSLRAALTDPVPAVRATAALALLEREQAPYPADLVAALAEGGGGTGFATDPYSWFHGVGDADSRLCAVLKEDPDALVTVARAFTTCGDLTGRGSRRAAELSETWRDRENDTVALLTAALPHEHEVWERSELLRALVRWLPGAGEPAPALGDHVLPHALADTPTTGEAQVVLGRLGDERLLTVVPEPSPEALAALATRTGRDDHRRRALRRARGHRLGELLDTFTAETARQLLPDLRKLLERHHDASLVRRLGDWGVPDGELLSVLAGIARDGDGELAVAAATSAARLGADPEPALRLLADRLRDSGRGLEDAAALGPAAVSLLPLVERHLRAGGRWERRRAAEAHWRITGDPTRAAPVLADLAGPSPVGVSALRVLLAMGPPFPDHLYQDLPRWAASERRVVECYDLFSQHAGARTLDDRIRDVARRMLA
ncbi:hypothetical protein OIB37_14510 [Streptomyces sp. NBC_00820]|uniref:hypothetical protein n=1 Tax=Streptomyces sp. NBC_00820 TaxID=2975842 RepID=UPI002ED058F1|nr:hypothetical protein OIB37_14510 [Streptomyces sp. NBC_00820]